MKRIKQMAAILCSAVMLVSGALSNAAVGTIPAETEVKAASVLTDSDFLTVKKGALVKENGEKVVLRGVNLGGWLIQESWMCPVNGEDRKWANLDTLNALESRFTDAQVQELLDTYQANWITEWDIANIASLGCNVVRVPFWYRNFMSDAQGTWIDENLDNNPGFKRLDWVIDTASKYGMYVILDMHGCPGGQSMDHCCGTLGKNELYTNETYLQTMQILWETIAARYKDNPVVAAYDIMNEPQNNGGYEGENSYDPWNSSSWEMSNAVYDRMIKAIRRIDTRHVITVEGIWRVSNLPDPAEMGWTNMMYQTHLYDDDAGFKTWTGAMADTMKQYGVAGYVGEFQNLNGMSMLNACDVNWTTWSYKGTADAGTFFCYYSTSIPNADTTSESFETIKEKWGEAIQTKNFREKTEVTDAFKTYTAGTVDEDDIVTEKEDLRMWNRYEAEDYTVVNGRLETQDFYSGGQAAGGMNKDTAVSDVASDWSNIAYVDFTDVTVDRAGTYTVKLIYNGDDDKVILVRVNNGENIQVELPRLGDGTWNVMHEAEIELQLAAGVNRIQVSGTLGGTGWSNIDCIDVEKKLLYEAEDYPINIGIREAQSFYSGGLAAGGMNVSTSLSAVASDWSNIAYVDFTDVTVDAAGQYTLRIAYNGDDDKYILIRINDGENIKIELPRLAGGAWDIMHEKDVQLNLNAGVNRIQVSGTLEGTGWANIDYIQILSPSTGEPVNNGSGETPVQGVVYEAEDARIMGGTVESQDFYSGGKGVGAMNTATLLADVASDWSNIKYVSFEQVSAEYTGRYKLKIVYNGDDDKVILVRVNGGENIAVELPRVSGGAWNIMHQKEMEIQLTEGVNQIQVSGTINDETVWANLDYIEVTPSETVKPSSDCSVVFMNEGQVYRSLAVTKGSRIEIPGVLKSDGKLFMGWFTEDVGEVTGADSTLAAKAFDFSQEVSQDTTLYAGWLSVGTVEKDASDTVTPVSVNNSGFYLVGAQYRKASENVTAGLRFITRISKHLISSLEAVNTANQNLQPSDGADKGIGYGTVITLKSNISNEAMIEKDVNASYVTTGMYVCPAVNVYREYADYQLFTAVVVGIPQSFYAQDIVARPYITYCDANGTEQTYYFTESGISNAGGGYYTSYQAVKEAAGE